MKQLIWKLVLPLNIISFGIFTKWWYALPVDAPDTMFRGFPLAYSCPGWHTSMSLQIFLSELIFDLLIYFLFWLVVVFCADRFLIKIRTFRWVTNTLWSVTGIFMAIGVLFATYVEIVFYVRRPFDMEIMETGYEFIWQDTKRPDYYQYHPEERKE
jgi:hypothetical protein